MTARRQRGLIAAVAALPLLALAGAVYVAADGAATREDRRVEWALRLPRERVRAAWANPLLKTLAGAPPRVAPGDDSAPLWEGLDAQLRVGTADGKLPGLHEWLPQYVDPDARATAKTTVARKVYAKYAYLLPEIARIARKKDCVLRDTGEGSYQNGGAMMQLGAILHLAAAIQERKRGDTETSVSHLLTALRIGRLLARQRSPISQLGDVIQVVTYRVLREGLTARNRRTRFAWYQATKRNTDALLLPDPREPTPIRQLAVALAAEHTQETLFIGKWRLEKYEADKNIFANYTKLLTFLNRLGFFLDNRLFCDAAEASDDYDIVGLMLRLRDCPAGGRIYPLAKSTVFWARHMASVTEGTDIWQGSSWWRKLLDRRLQRDTERALTVAVVREVGGETAPPPEDPFAPTAGTPLRSQRLPNGGMTWSSVGDAGLVKNGRMISVTVPPLAP